MIGAVLLLFVSIAYEHSKADCWQTSISAYYYTPVRAIFVGSLFAVSLALIVYKGESVAEDLFLNLAGMFVPIVAVAPTTDLGICWSVPPIPGPLNADGSLAPWVVANIQNNMFALLVVGAIGVVIAFVLAIRPTTRDLLKQAREEGRVAQLRSVRVLGAAVFVLLLTWVLVAVWDNFDTRAHGYAAVLFFVFLFLAIVSQALVERGTTGTKRQGWRKAYAVIAAAMFVAAAFFYFVDVGDHAVALLESAEIVLFATYWITQTFEKSRPGDEEANPSLRIDTMIE
jgi:hypothetical protein